MKPFDLDDSDGCTLWPEGWFGKNTWHWACVEHDIAYYYGGSRADRLRADRKMWRDVADTGHPIVASLMYIGVRMGGAPYFNTKWRWGFGREFEESFLYRKQGK